MKHKLEWKQPDGKLAEALGISREDTRAIEATVELALRDNWSMKRLFETIGEMDLSDETWANFLYTFGYFDGARRR